MKLKFLIISALSNVAAHKARSFLTVLGIMIGVSAIIAVVSIGEGATDLVMGEIDQLGANTIVAAPGNMESGFMDYFFVEMLDMDDLNALEKQANVPDLKAIAPAVVAPGKVSYMGESYSGAMTIGSKADFFTDTYNMLLDSGVNFTSTDIDNRERVAVIGSKVKEELFGQDDPLGERITIGESRFRVIGVYRSRGNVGPTNMDEVIIIPYTAAQTYITGSNEFQEVYIKIKNSEDLDRAVVDVTATLRESRGIRPGESDNFSVMTQEGIQKMIGDVMNILNAFLVFVVSISLLVGGIGIMNIMLVTVTERTREIGLRKALGATHKAILEQFLWEAIILTVLGGVAGIIFGVLVSFGASLVLSEVLAFSWPFSFPYQAAILGVGISALVGLVFGLYPANQAADKDPIEALQYEK
ncbi:MAG: ABC transporter permease [Patescibacteria group bacterium]